ncbi:MAG TPA: F0F1 ATP synthase subunit B [Candidatus Saccharimonadales bacterium]|nr:F0F1 ATP synthase subunit B [Candidatus Saccharimonadales bacterium]
MNILTQFGATEEASGNVLDALGIDISMLIFQTIAFLILVWLLGKYVYPIFIKVVDERQAKIEESTVAAAEAEKKAHDAKVAIDKLMKEARKEAGEIVLTAKEEATAAIEAAEAKSKVRAERIVEDAHAQIDKDIVAAKKALHNETLELVALATEKVVGKTVTAKVDDAVISAAVKGAR